MDLYCTCKFQSHKFLINLYYLVTDVSFIYLYLYTYTFMYMIIFTYRITHMFGKIVTLTGVHL